MHYVLASLRSSGSINEIAPVDRLRIIGLTQREAEAAVLIARGFMVRLVAEQMGVEIGTVKTLLFRAREKLACKNAHELAILLLRNEIVLSRELFDPHNRQQLMPPTDSAIEPPKSDIHMTPATIGMSEDKDELTPRDLEALPPMAQRTPFGARSSPNDIPPSLEARPKTVQKS